MKYLLSSLAIQDFYKNPPSAAKSIQKLIYALQTASSFSKLNQHLGIKRLKYIKPTTWRHRNGDWRTVFTISNPDPDSRLIIHRCALRRDVYSNMPEYLRKGLSEHLESIVDVDDRIEESLEDIYTDLEVPDENYCFHDRHYFLPHTLLENNLQEDVLINFITSGCYLHMPCLTGEQRHSVSQLLNRKPQIYRMQGAAGTGKTTVSFELAAKVVEQGGFPVIILPNRKLVYFGFDSLAASYPDLKINSDLTTDTQADIAIFARDELFQQLAGTGKLPLTTPEANKLIDEIIKRDKQYKHLKGQNLYALFCGFICEDSYHQSSKDSIAQTYAESVQILSSFKGSIEKVLQGKDLISQSQNASRNLQNNNLFFQEISKNRSLFLIIDEVQDYYWFQLSVLLNLSLSKPLQASIFLLGDENQRVTLSGFSWTALANRMGENKPLEIAPPQQNFRNTRTIAKAAKFILTEAFDRKNFTDKARHSQSPSNPDYCFEEGSRPQLIQADSKWLDALLACLLEQSKSEDDSSKYVFIIRDEAMRDSELIQISEQETSCIIAYTIAQAKGQEFDAAILVFPFARKSHKQKLSIEDLYNWYTSITRARRYLALLVTTAEMVWLKENLLHEESLNEVFEVVDNLTPHSFAQQMQYKARAAVTASQLQHRKIGQIVRNIFTCLIEPAKLKNYDSFGHAIDLSPWEVFDLVYQEAKLFAESAEAQTQIDAIKADIPRQGSIYNNLILYAGAAPFFNAEQLTAWEDALVIDLETFFQAQPDTREGALQHVQDPVLRVLILRGCAYSWNAAEIASNNVRLIQGICTDLERRTLRFEARRLQAQYLKEKIQQDLIFLPQLIEYKGLLVNGLCEELTKSILARLEE